MPVKFLHNETVLSNASTMISGFPATMEETAEGQLRLWYTAIGANEKFCGIYRATETAPGHFTREGFTASSEKVSASEQALIDNLPAGWQPVQPVRIALKGGGYRLWFWCHCPAEGIVRFITAYSSDDCLYHIENPYAPCLWHYCDRACPSQLPGVSGLAFNSSENQQKRPAFEQIAPQGMVCNDATTVYQLPDGTFELYSAAIRQVEKGTPEYVEWDNAAGYRRIIVRYTSEDGVHFTPCGPVIEPDSDDPPYLQFYYLSVAYLDDGHRLGFLGRYDAMAQTADLELCTSEDGFHWCRTHKPLFQRRPQDLCIYAEGNPLRITPDGFEIFYTACNYQHNHRYCTQEHNNCEIVRAVFAGKPEELLDFW